MYKNPYSFYNFVSVSFVDTIFAADIGEVYAWGYGKAIGRKHKDILSPELVHIRTHSVVQVAGGATHSLVLTGEFNTYPFIPE